MAQKFVETALTGFQLLSDPLLNKGTAFTEQERDTFALHGLLPPHVGTLEDQIARRLLVFRSLASNFEKYSFLRDLLDRNETLFYALLIGHMEEMLPIVYTPTVGEGCERFSEIWRTPNGVFLSYPNRARISQILAHPRYDGVRCIVVSDGERILGLGDQGAGGMGIPIGKLSLYTALGGINPRLCLPILLDVGTDNEERLRSPLYIGWSHRRVRGQDYDDFIETFVTAVMKRWPNVLLQWEDFARGNAARLLERYRDRLCTFNDDIQGTAAVATGTLLAAANVTGVPLTEQRIAMLGFGSAGRGIASLLKNAMIDAGLSESEARGRFYPVGIGGLMVEGGAGIEPDQRPWVRSRCEIAGWNPDHRDHITLLDVVRNVKPHVLIGTSGAGGAFTEEIVRAMAAGVDRPAIFPLSNPTSHSEAIPEDLMRWTGGRAVIGTGSPFPNVDQTNNSYIFPGVALGVIASNARRMTDRMFMAAARALADLSPAKKDKQRRLLPPVTELRSVSVEVAIAVARQAGLDGVADPIREQDLASLVRAQVWEPEYLPCRLKA
ncbi:MAG TPA: NAD-dependent malic enzyme [Bryobacteraceae bacterium]|nr:NAD-dependent malic enzyme [Bryobacteraceae bacterium]